MTFPVMNPKIAQALAERGYDEPTPVQRAVLEPETEGRDLLVSAQTGSGKTVAFGAALAPTLLGEAERFGTPGKPLALIIAPTRELALQVQRELEWLYGTAGGKIASCVGGMDIRREARALEAGCHVVVGTPGRLKDHLSRKRLDLSALKGVVLDEADEMLDMGFKEDLEYILDATPADRRTLMFSATIPHDIATLAKRYQTNALRIATTRDREAHADIEYRAIRVASAEMERAVVNVLRFYEVGATIVFCSTREGVKRLHGSLIERGFAAVALSGELSQAERTNALQSLRDRRARVCVATDVAARGLDLPDLGLVVHADLPNDRETLLHRSGRTGRAGRKGLCVLLVPPHKRRRAEMLIQAANIKATWAAAPTADEIRIKDQERMLTDATFAEESTEEDLVVARALLAVRSGEEVALALARVLRAKLPAPEEVTDPGIGGFKDRHSTDRARVGVRGTDERPRFEKRGPREVPAYEGGDRGPPRDRLNPDETVWFRINIGRNRNADPKWLIPLICKSGGITKAEIGSIRIFDADTRFQIAKDKADAFGNSVKDKTENNTIITPAFGPESRVSAPPRQSTDGVFAQKGATAHKTPTPYKGKGTDRDKDAYRGKDTYKGKDDSKSFKPKWKDKEKSTYTKDKPAFSKPARQERADNPLTAYADAKPMNQEKPPFRKFTNDKPYDKGASSKAPLKPYKAKKKQKASMA